jgi:hypothetical protein
MRLWRSPSRPRLSASLAPVLPRSLARRSLAHSRSHPLSLSPSLPQKIRTVDGQPTSLKDLGYDMIGIDEGWEGCGQGVNGTQHYVNGTPAIRPDFPDLKSLVDYAHSKGMVRPWA